MHSEVIHANTQRVLEKIKKSAFIKQFYLAGGTALAIQIGHRESIDLDWFSPEKFSIEQLRNGLADLGTFMVENQAEGTLHGVLDGVKITFLRYEYKQLYPFIEFKGIKIADGRDIAAMKLDAVSSRGSKKDFIDIYFLLKKYSLSELIGFFENKYSHLQFNTLHILKSLCYFDDAEGDPMPVMLQDVQWRDIKANIRKAVNEYL